MHWLVAWSVRRRVVVTVLAAVFLVLGTTVARKTPVDVVPEFVPAQVAIQTEAAGFTPGQVETLITQPIEVAVNGAPGLAAMRSDSISIPPADSANRIRISSSCSGPPAVQRAAMS